MRGVRLEARVQGFRERHKGAVKQPEEKCGAACVRTVRLQEKRGLGTQEDPATATEAAREEWTRPPRLDQDSCGLQWTY